MEPSVMIFTYLAIYLFTHGLIPLYDVPIDILVIVSRIKAKFSIL